LVSAASGTLAATGIGVAGQVFGNASISATNNIANKATKGESINGGELAGQTAIGGLS
jgi:hypothetical protein